MNIYGQKRVFSPADEGTPAAGTDAGTAAAAQEATPGAAQAEPGAAAASQEAGAGDEKFAWFGDELAQDEKDYLDNKGFDSPRKLFKSLRAAESMIRGDKISGPPEDPEKHGDWLKESGLAKRLGVPEEPSGYEIQAPDFGEDATGMINYDDERHGRVLAAAHQANLTPAQTSAMLELYKTEIAADVQAFNDAATADETEMRVTLTKDWGDGYDQNVTAALETAKEYGLSETQMEALRTGKIAGSATLTKMLYDLALTRGNDSLKGGARPGTGAQTKAEAQRSLDEFMAKNGEALTKHDHPEHATAVTRMQELKKAAGRGSVGMES